MLVPTCSSSNESAAVAAHAKPLLIQGALFAARALNNNDGGHGDGGGLSSDGGGVSSSKSSSNSSSSSVAGFELFRPYKDKMFALLDYWERERLDAKSGLYTWHDQVLVRKRTTLYVYFERKKRTTILKHPESRKGLLRSKR
jgi:hypothetical protein